MAHIETMVSFGRKNISMTNKKSFLGLRMLEKHLESLGIEPTTVLDYSKPLSNFRGHFGGQDRTGQDRVGTYTGIPHLVRIFGPKGIVLYQ